MRFILSFTVFLSEHITHNIIGTSHGINFEDMDVAALLKDDTEDDAFSEVKVCNIKLTAKSHSTTY